MLKSKYLKLLVILIKYLCILNINRKDIDELYIFKILEMIITCLITYSIFSIFTFSIFIKFNNVLSKPYMDEIFHIPQAQRYCNGSYNDVI